MIIIVYTSSYFHVLFVCMDTFVNAFHFHGPIDKMNDRILDSIIVLPRQRGRGATRRARGGPPKKKKLVKCPSPG